MKSHMALQGGPRERDIEGKQNVKRLLFLIHISSRCLKKFSFFHHYIKLKGEIMLANAVGYFPKKKANKRPPPQQQRHLVAA